jgi:hypothetical protein
MLVFKVVDGFGRPLPGERVLFRLSTEVGGLSLSNASDISDTNGLVRTTVRAGSVSTHIRVHATIQGSNPLVTVASDELLVSTGLPDQNSISMSAKPLNPEALIYNNATVSVLFQAADHFNNFVPDGSVVYFSTELGSIEDSCIIENGVCTVTWRSGNPRYSYCDQLLPACLPFQSTILAFMVGEESFIDINGNGFFDPDDIFDTFTDMGEPFRDDNNNGIRDPWEPWWDFNGNGRYDGVPNRIYNGSLCSDEAEALELCTKELVYVQDSLVIVLSGSYATITFSPTAANLANRTHLDVNIRISDENGYAMPAGSSVRITTTNGAIVGDSSFTIPSTLLPSTFTVRLEPTPDDGKSTGFLQVKVTTPNGNITNGEILVTD